jgi:DNA-binding response OmpR family regulator
VEKVLLVVDDSITIRTAVELIFEGTEYRVVAKPTGEAGLAWMRTNTPDLILVDERMPDMDGYEFGTQIKADDKNEDVPILLLACQDGPDESKADTADLDGYVNKPFGSQELVTLVEMLTGSSQISQMPLSFKEQLLQRQRDKAAKGARNDSAASAHPSEEDEQLAFEAALASVDGEAKKPKPEPKPKLEPKKEPPTLELPIGEDDEEVTPVPVQTKPARKPTAPPRPQPREVEIELGPSHDDFTPEPVTPSPVSPKIPHADLMQERPPPRFPPAHHSTPDLAIPLPGRRESSPAVQRPKPDPIFLKESLPPPPPPRPPPPPMEAPSRTPDLMIEAPVEADDPVLRPPEKPKADKPKVEKPKAEPAKVEPPKPPEPPKSEPKIEIEAPATTWSADQTAEPVMPTQPPRPTPASSRGLLFALIALAVIGGLVAFLFVSS